MSFRKAAVLAVACVVFSGLPARAQVEKVVVEAEGMSRTCGPGLETALKSLDSVYKYAINLDKQMFVVFYYKDGEFDPKQLRWAARKGEAGVLRLHVSAVGKVEQDGDQQFFIAGQSRFLLQGTAKLATDATYGMIGVADDQQSPMVLTPDDVQPVDSAASPEAPSKSQPESHSSSGQPAPAAAPPVQ